MAFLAHAIPWNSLSSKLEHKAPRSGPGPQHARIAFNRQQTTIGNLEHFARKFQDVLREHATDERKKFRSPKDYIARAEAWESSTSEADELPDSTQLKLDEASVDIDSANARRIRRNLELRKLRDTLDETSWTTTVERRFVYPTFFIEKYFRAYEAKHTWMYFLDRSVGRNIQDWLEWSRSESQDRGQVDERAHTKTTFELNDVLKLLVIESACATRVENQNYTIETLFLLVHHPKLSLEYFIGRSMDCCNFIVGFEMTAIRSLRLFLLLNLLASMQDKGVSEITVPMRTAVVFHNNSAFEIDSASQWDSPWAAKCVELLPRPAYMNLRVWRGVVKMLCRNHENLAESVLFSKILFPLSQNGQNGQCLPVEVDLLSDHGILKDRMKRLWRVMVVTDMILRELGSPLNWEYLILECLGDLFEWPLDPKSWYHYELQRQAASPAVSELPYDRRLFTRFAWEQK